MVNEELTIKEAQELLEEAMERVTGRKPQIKIYVHNSRAEFHRIAVAVANEYGEPQLYDEARLNNDPQEKLARWYNIGPNITVFA